MTKYLIEQGSDIHAWNDGTLIYSAENGHLEVVKYLLMDCNMNIKKSTLKYLHKKNFLEVINIFNYRELNNKLDNNLNHSIINSKYQYRI
jgi:hypothetical protein